MDRVRGDVPPVADTVQPPYAAYCVPLSAEPAQVPAEIESAFAATVIGSVTVVLVEVESVTLNVTDAAETAPVGVPLIRPVLLFTLSPAGRLQVDGQLHVYGRTPPVAVN
jgi:hypothetical protein